MTDKPTPPTVPMCPVLSAGQIVPRTLLADVIPIGEASVSGGGGLSLDAIKGRGRGPLDLSHVSKKVTVYQARGALGYKTPKDTKPDDPNAVLLPNAARVPCQGPECEWFCHEHQKCLRVCSCESQRIARQLAIAFQSALQDHDRSKKANQNQEETVEQPEPA